MTRIMGLPLSFLVLLSSFWDVLVGLFGIGNCAIWCERLRAPAVLASERLPVRYGDGIQQGWTGWARQTRRVVLAVIMLILPIPVKVVVHGPPDTRARRTALVRQRYPPQRALDQPFPRHILQATKACPVPLHVKQGASLVPLPRYPRPLQLPHFGAQVPSPLQRGQEISSV
jgi:hypothetical protein